MTDQRSLPAMARAPVWMRVVVTAAIALSAVWGGLALFYRLPLPNGATLIPASLFGALALVAVADGLRGRSGRVVGLYALTFAGLIVWWMSLTPERAGDWAPDVARQVTGEVSGDTLTLTNVRNFRWRSDADMDERWETRTYDLTKLRTLDVFMSYWGGPAIAHMIVSFGFEDGAQLAWSAEVRRRRDDAFSPVGDLFKIHPLVLIAADERDVVGVRSNVRREDVQLYRLNTPPAAARAMLLDYVAEANGLAATPQFYNSITTNCTTAVVKMARAGGAEIAFDWRLVVNGYLPDYLYDRGLVTRSLPLSELRSRAHIDALAQAAGFSDDFSQRIRAAAPR